MPVIQTIVQEDFNNLSESFFLRVWQRSEECDVRLKHLFPQGGEWLFHDPLQPPRIAAEPTNR